MNRGKLAAALVLSVIAIAIPAAALASAGSSQVWITTCTKAAYKPSTVILACGDGSAYLAGIKWSSWSGTKASGSGSEKVNDCSPSCVNGHFKSFRVELAASHPIHCPKLKHKVFDDLAITYPGTRPKGNPKTLKDSLGCPY